MRAGEHWIRYSFSIGIPFRHGEEVLLVGPKRVGVGTSGAGPGTLVLVIVVGSGASGVAGHGGD